MLQNPYFCIINNELVMRNTDLTEKRDRKMVEMFYQLYDVKRLRLDDVLRDLSEKMFFLDQDYIYKRIFYISSNQQYYDSLKSKKGGSGGTSQLSLF